MKITTISKNRQRRKQTNDVWCLIRLLFFIANFCVACANIKTVWNSYAIVEYVVDFDVDRFQSGDTTDYNHNLRTNLFAEIVMGLLLWVACSGFVGAFVRITTIFVHKLIKFKLIRQFRVILMFCYERSVRSIAGFHANEGAQHYQSYIPCRLCVNGTSEFSVDKVQMLYSRIRLSQAIK